MSLFEVPYTDYSLKNPKFVEVNRKGEIPPGQKDLLEKRLMSYLEFLRGGTAWKQLQIWVWLWFFLTISLWSLEIPDQYALLFFLLGLLGISAGSVWSWQRSQQQARKINEELTAGVIESGRGEVVFQGGEYQASVKGRDLKVPRGSRRDLEPGVQYRFFFLPESRMLLSAEVLSPLPEREAVRGLTEVLADVNHFQLSALPHNRRGILTGQQTGKLSKPILIGVFLILFPLFLAFVGLTRENGYLRPLLDARSMGDVFQYLSPTAIILILSGTALALFGLYYLRTAVMDLLNREVATWEGVGFRQRKQSRDEDMGTRTNYFYVIGGKEFQVGERAYQAFENGKNYRVYFTPRRKVLVNIEVLD